MLTLVLCTARSKPGFEEMADSLSVSANHFYTPFELIVVDKLLWGEKAIERRTQLQSAIKDRFSFRHVAPKLSPWQGPARKTKRDYYALCSARNTGIILARGSQVVLFDDCSTVNEEFLYWHDRGRQQQIAIAGSFRSYLEPGKLHPSGIDHRGEIMTKAPGGWMYGLNISFPLTAAINLNGYDETFDGQGGSEDCHFGIRLQKAGIPIIYIPQCQITQTLTNHEPVCDFTTWGVKQIHKQKERILEADNKPHFANEWLIQEWAKNPFVRAPNNFNMLEARTTALTTGELPPLSGLTHDWRDGAKLENCE